MVRPGVSLFPLGRVISTATQYLGVFWEAKVTRRKVKKEAMEIYIIDGFKGSRRCQLSASLDSGSYGKNNEKDNRASGATYRWFGERVAVVVVADGVIFPVQKGPPVVFKTKCEKAFEAKYRGARDLRGFLYCCLVMVVFSFLPLGQHSQFGGVASSAV